ncbi:UNVERIFIED_CONTAM: hypothetical protein FKN15_015635 [Acipenser sinensis]
MVISELMVGSEDWDPVEVDLLLEELRDIPVTPEKKGKSSKVSGGGKDPGKGGNTQLKKNTSTTSYIKYLEPTRRNTDTCQTGLSKAVNLDVRPKASYGHQMRRSGSACNTSTPPNMQKLREPTGFKSRGQGFSSFQPWKKGSVQPMPLLSTKLIMEETRSLKLDKKKPISSNLSKGITNILENTSEFGSEDCDTVDIDLLEELRDIPVTPEKKGKSNKVSGGDAPNLCSAAQSLFFSKQEDFSYKSCIIKFA